MGDGEKMLEGKKCLIRPITVNDFELTYKWKTEQKHMGQFMGAKMIYKDSYMEGMKNIFSNNKSFVAIIEDLNYTPIGMINYSKAVDTDSSLDIGILIANPSVRGKGIGEEALNMFVNYIFSAKPEIMRIQYKTRVDNTGMVKIGEKVGFKIEGTLRNYIFDQGENRDYYLAAIIREEWNQNRQNN